MDFTAHTQVKTDTVESAQSVSDLLRDKTRLDALTAATLKLANLTTPVAANTSLVVGTTGATSEQHMEGREAFETNNWRQTRPARLQKRRRVAPRVSVILPRRADTAA